MTTAKSIAQSTPEHQASLISCEKVGQSGEDLLQVMLESEPKIDRESGLRVVELDVKDGYEGELTRRVFDRRVARLQKKLEAHPEWQPPLRPKDEVTGKSTAVIPRNPVSKKIYGDESSRRWGVHMPDSYALWNLYHPEEDTLPDGTEVTDHMQMVFKHLLDARAIRNRGTVTEALGLKYAFLNGRDDYRWVSFGGGASVPAMNGLSAIHNALPNASLRATVYDLDDAAMRFGIEKVRQRGLDSFAAFETRRADLGGDFVATQSPVVQEILDQGGATFAENIGLTEYFGKSTSVRMIKNGYESIAPGGGFVFSNMRHDRGQLALNQRGIGWNKMHVRTLPDLAELMEKAGIDPGIATVYRPADSVYSVVEIPKPEQEPTSPTIALRALGKTATVS